MKNQSDLEQALLADKDIKRILEIVASLEVEDAWLCAGTLRNFLWNGGVFDLETDVDVIFHDAAVSYEEMLAIEKYLRQTYPSYQWEVKNQVYMHQHSPHTQPYTSSKDAMSKYPERCTAIGARLLGDKQVEIYCPYGLEEILRYRVRPTPHFQENPERMSLYRSRLTKKNWQQKWPNLQIEL
ncbi:nucleotidyltransferase family protein [Streptococcus suis]|nr:nucleotidyltransferase family protein [Streptococcus suis]HEL9645608.1 nucleotidyltransferase family protein [Streptococcus suis]